MAEKRFIKGLFKDTSHLDQLEGSWRHARNMILNDTAGAVSNEGGTELAGHLGTNTAQGSQNDKVIGGIEVDKDRVILFILDVVSATSPTSEIGIWENGTYKILFNPLISSSLGKPSNDLNFKESNPIEGTFKIDSKGDLVVYWTDDLNPPRAFNVDRQIRESGGGNIDAIDITQLYGITSLDLDNINILNLFPYSGPVPHIYIHDIYWATPYPFQRSIIEGGGLLTGVYYLALAYVDDDLVATNYLTVSNPVSIVDEFDHTRPTTKKDGAKAGSQTSKAIKWRVDNINTDYKYLRPVIIRKMGDAIDAYRLNLSEIAPDSNGNQTIVFSGIEGSSPASVDEIIIDTTSYEKAKTINQLDGVLYLGNLEGTKDVGYQKYANNIKLIAKTKKFDNFDTFYATLDNLESGFGNGEVDWFDGEPRKVGEGNSYRYIPNITNWKGYMRDEVYAFYIAFILNDGSMSYAYHIPGREKLTDSKLIDTENVLEGDDLSDLISSSALIYEDLQNLSKGYAKNYHFFDFSELAGPATSGGQDRNMNYWENSTEVYPNTSNYEVWDRAGLLTNIQNDNVRHHHFPSNESRYFQTVTGSYCPVEDTNPDIFTGLSSVASTEYGKRLEMTFRGTDLTINQTTNNIDQITLNHFSSNSPEGFDMLYTTEWQKNKFPVFTPLSTAINSNAAVLAAFVDETMSAAASNILWDGETFTANQPLVVDMQFDLYHVNGGVGVNDEYHTEVIHLHADDGTETVLDSQSQYYTTLNNLGLGTMSTACQDTWGGASVVWLNQSVPYGMVHTSKTYTTFAALEGIIMETGDKLYIRTKVDEDLGGEATPTTGTSWTWSGQVHNQSSDCFENTSQIQFRIYPGNGWMDEKHRKDVKIEHKVRALGFTLDDVQIPKSIADKIQGFRIYRAKREHANKRILGQSIALPMQPDRAKIGLCKNAWDYTSTGDSQQIMSTLQETPETILRKDPWPRDDVFYPNYNLYSGNSVTASGTGYKSFSFPNFNLLRTKNSISGATHIKPEYRVSNLVWNGATMVRDKKMISKIVEDDGGGTYNPPIKKVVEEWGYDADLNCHSKEIGSAVFIGNLYERYQSGEHSPAYWWYNPKFFSLPRVIGQKAKSYLKGDSIFNAESLGFGGTVLNDGGESTFIFSLKDNHEMQTLGQSTALPYHAWDFYGIWTPANPFYLVSDGRSSGNPSTTYLRTSNIDICNLHAFKTDVYKSIDTQELVWTGFEVLGQDIQNFIFDDNTGNPLNFDYIDNTGTNNHDADFSILTLQQDIQKDYGGNQIDESQYHIFGGDTFICRYGVVSKLEGMDSNSPSNIEKGLHYHIVESTDNINFRHAESDDSLYFPGTSARSVLQSKGDLTHMDNIKYNDNYSEDNDIRPAFPLPSNIDIQDDFPTRTHRSAKNDTTSLIDNYRIFLANQFKDLPKNRGDLWKLSTFNNLLYFHMEDSLFASKGKQQMEMKDGSEAFVGSGDIFKQDPEEIIQTEDGFGGTQSQYAALTTRSGYFFVDSKSRKVFLMKDSLSEISKLGMSTWFQDNLKFALEEYLFLPTCNLDNPIEGMGFHSVYDPEFKRIILTKREFLPTDLFLSGINTPITAPPTDGAIIFDSDRCTYQRAKLGIFIDLSFSNTQYFTKSGWTISYYTELGVWGSFHDYVPYIYFNTSTKFYSLTDQYNRPAWIPGTFYKEHVGTTFGNAGIWEHNSSTNYGILYQENVAGAYTNAEWLYSVDHKPLEFEFIHNEFKGEDTLLGSINYTLETFNQAGISVLEHGFTAFFIYNTFQISGIGNDFVDINNIQQSDSNGTLLSLADRDLLEYLINIRRVGNNWKINNFRDMANTALDSSTYYTSTETNIIGGTNTGTVTTSSTQNMFTYSGMRKIVNASYLDLSKNWNLQRKFMDKWVGIRLICDNISNNLLNLYSTNVGVRKIKR